MVPRPSQIRPGVPGGFPATTFRLGAQPRDKKMAIGRLFSGLRK